MAKGDYETKDSGKREQFDTGSQRDTRDGKGRYDLIPQRARRRLALLYERGAKKYGDNNWRLGQPNSRFMDSLLRHADEAAQGMVDEDHLAAVVFNAYAIMDQQERIAEGTLDAVLDDLP